MNFALLQYASKAPARLLHQPKPMCSPNLLSWSFVCPSADIPGAQVSPTSPRRAPLRMPGANQPSRSASVVSLHRDGLLCAPAPSLLQLGTGHGVHCVSAFPEPERETSLDRPGPVGRLPRNAVHTPRRIPLVNSRTASLRPWPSCGCHLFRLRVPARSEERALSNSPLPPAETNGRLHSPTEAEVRVASRHGTAVLSTAETMS